MWYTVLASWKIKPYNNLNRCRKSFWQNSAPIYDKSSSKIGQEETCPNIIKAIYNKHTANILNAEKLKASSLRSVTRQGAHSCYYYSTNFGNPSYGNQRRKRNKRNLDLKGRSKILPICRWHDTVHSIMYYHVPKDTIRKSLELVSEFSKVTGHKINM